MISFIFFSTLKSLVSAAERRGPCFAAFVGLIVGTTSGLYTDQIQRQVDEDGCNLVPSQLLSNTILSRVIDALNLGSIFANMI